MGIVSCHSVTHVAMALHLTQCIENRMFFMWFLMILDSVLVNNVTFCKVFATCSQSFSTFSGLFGLAFTHSDTFGYIRMHSEEKFSPKTKNNLNLFFENFETKIPFFDSLVRFLKSHGRAELKIISPSYFALDRLIRRSVRPKNLGFGKILGSPKSFHSGCRWLFSLRN